MLFGVEQTGDRGREVKDHLHLALEIDHICAAMRKLTDAVGARATFVAISGACSQRESYFEPYTSNSPCGFGTDTRS